MKDLSPSKELYEKKAKFEKKYLQDEYIRDLSFVMQIVKNPLYARKQLPILIPTTVFFKDGYPYLMVENLTEVAYNEVEEEILKSRFNPEKAELGSLVYEERIGKIRTSEFRRIFGERCRKFYPTPFTESDASKMLQSKNQQSLRQTPCIDISLFREHVSTQMPHLQIMQLLEKLNREGMNLKASKLLYEYFSSKRLNERLDNNYIFNLMVRNLD